MQGKFLTVLFWGQLTLIPKCDKDITQDRKLWCVLEVLTNVTRETNERKAHSLKMEQPPPQKKTLSLFSNDLIFEPKKYKYKSKKIKFNKWINEVYGFKVITEIYNVFYSEA